ncbi:Extracellular exo-alpha-L-arabinofuranosidase precursor [compost metagenome]
MSPEWFLTQHNRYESFKADEPKVFLGEYASWGNTYYNALAEAAFMTGLERNAHAVGLACYAPMLCNVDYVNWKPDLIWFNNHEVFGTANYYVQKLFMHHQGDQLLRIEADGFRMPQAAIEETTISGALALGADVCTAEYWDIRLTNNDTGESEHFDGKRALLTDTIEDRKSGKEKPVLELGSTQLRNYTLKVKAKKLGGQRGFFINFGVKDHKQLLTWEISGWQNQDSMITSTIGGRTSCLTQSLFTVQEGVEYELALEVSGRRVRTYINGKLINETEDKPLIIEPLYYSASIEHETGDTIVKVVNVQDSMVAAKIELDGGPQRSIDAEVFELSGYALDEENSFEAPERIVPKESSIAVEGGSFAYEFPQHSITVFRLKTR